MHLHLHPSFEGFFCAMRIKESPFTGWFTSFGGGSADSVAGLLLTGNRSEGVKRRQDVLKWNRQELAAYDEVVAAAELKEKSIKLYQEALGYHFIVPTSILVGDKRDVNGLKHKVYQIQPYIDGWNAKEAPEDIRNHPAVVTQWNILSKNLFSLYHSANEINRRFPQGAQFPITMTVGSSRQNAYVHEFSEHLPLTKNIIISRDTLQLQLFDFGGYVMWQDSMQDAYDIINRVTRLPRHATVFPIVDHKPLLQADDNEQAIV